jgi:hypothetical protein
MSLAWSTPNTASAGGVISAYAYNTYVRDNLNYLLQRPSAQIIYAGASDRLTNSGNWDVIDATNLTLNLTLANTRALIMATFWATVDNASGNYGAFDILIDGTTRIGGTNGLVRFPLSVGSNPVTLIGYAINLPLGAHTFQIVAKSSVAGINTTVLNNGLPITLMGFEV